METKLLELRNALLPMVSTEAGIMILVKNWQSGNALSPMAVIVFGKVIEVIPPGAVISVVWFLLYNTPK